MHPRLVNVATAGAEWDVYVGRGNCPRRGPAGRTRFGNPWPVARYGVDAMKRYLDHVEKLLKTVPAFGAAVRELRGKVLGCWCVGRYPCCHGEVLARLADAVDMLAELVLIRADLLARLEPQAELFGAPARASTTASHED